MLVLRNVGNKIDVPVIGTPSGNVVSRSVRYKLTTVESGTTVRMLNNTVTKTHQMISVACCEWLSPSLVVVEIVAAYLFSWSSTST